MKTPLQVLTDPDFCRKIGEILDVDPHHVHPIDMVSDINSESYGAEVTIKVIITKES
jgi:hypothetical protein